MEIFLDVFLLLPEEGLSEYLVAKTQAGRRVPEGPRSMPGGGGEEGGEGGSAEEGERSRGWSRGEGGRWRGKSGLRMFSMENGRDDGGGEEQEEEGVGEEQGEKEELRGEPASLLP